MVLYVQRVPLYIDSTSSFVNVYVLCCGVCTDNVYDDSSDIMMEFAYQRVAMVNVRFSDNEWVDGNYPLQFTDSSLWMNSFTGTTISVRD